MNNTLNNGGNKHRNVGIVKLERLNHSRLDIFSEVFEYFCNIFNFAKIKN